LREEGFIVRDAITETVAFGFRGAGADGFDRFAEGYEARRGAAAK